MATDKYLDAQVESIADRLHHIAAGHLYTDGYTFYSFDGDCYYYADSPCTPYCHADSAEADDLTQADMFDWLRDQLEVHYIVNNMNVYRAAIITCTIGGPTIRVDTYDGCITGRWGTDESRFWLDSDVCDAIDETLEELHNANCC